MRIPHPNALLLEVIRDRLSIEAKALTHRLERQAICVELGGEVHLSRAHLARANRDSGSVQNGPHGGAMQAELASDVIHSLALLVRRDDFHLPFSVQVTLGLDAWTRRD